MRSARESARIRGLGVALGRHYCRNGVLATFLLDANGQDKKLYTLSLYHLRFVSIQPSLRSGGGKHIMGHIRGDLSSGRSPNLAPDLSNSRPAHHWWPNPSLLVEMAFRRQQTTAHETRTRQNFCRSRACLPGKVAVVSAKSTESVPSRRAAIFWRVSFISLIQAKRCEIGPLPANTLTLVSHSTRTDSKYRAA